VAWPRFPSPLISRVENWRAGRLARNVRTSRIARPICFMPRLMGPILRR
jgi:hypothetical protein